MKSTARQLFEDSVSERINTSFQWLHHRGRPKRDAREEILRGIGVLSDEEKIMLSVMLEEFHGILLLEDIDSEKHGGSVDCGCVVAQMIWKITRPGEIRKCATG